MKGSHMTNIFEYFGFLNCIQLRFGKNTLYALSFVC